MGNIDHEEKANLSHEEGYTLSTSSVCVTIEPNI